VSGYPPIADHGLIGDLRTVALVDTAATIDWYCCPRFVSPSVFGSLLDAERGGSFRLAPDREVTTTKQLYLPDTNMLITRFLSEDGVGEVQDFMPVAKAGEHRQCLVRRVVVVRGSMTFRLEVTRGTHHQPARTAGRRAELGLPLHLDP
jgi:GH15 family glucan-1,4-alpha-glucosidase